MHRIYRIPARPFWNHWQVLTSFYGTLLALGTLTLVLVEAIAGSAAGHQWGANINDYALIVFTGIFIEVVGLYFHRRDLVAQGGEGAAAYFEQVTRFGRTYLARNLGLAVSMILVLAIPVLTLKATAALFVWAVVTLLYSVTAITGRALFYALVIPTTMPGAFFWRNKKFQEHARETGLAEMSQVGVLPDLH
jgi:DMSO reductase anchor subunit